MILNFFDVMLVFFGAGVELRLNSLKSNFCGFESRIHLLVVDYN